MSDVCLTGSFSTLRILLSLCMSSSGRQFHHSFSIKSSVFQVKCRISRIVLNGKAGSNHNIDRNENRQGQQECYKNTLKANQDKGFEGNEQSSIEKLPYYYQAILNFQSARITTLKKKTAWYKARSKLSPMDGDHICNVCSKICKSQLVLLSHMH